MIIMNNNISFKMNIKPISQQEFANIVLPIGKNRHVGFPWTVKQSVLDTDAFTTYVLDCTSLGFTDGVKVLLMHLCPSMVENNDIKQIFQYIEKKLKQFNLKSLQSFIIGSQTTSDGKSENLHNGLVDFLKNKKVPFSQFKRGTDMINAAYSSKTDTLYLSSREITNNTRCEKLPKDIIRDMFEEYHISELDEII